MPEALRNLTDEALARLKSWPLTRPFYFLPENWRRWRRVHARLERASASPDLILVHQMGKVGSSTVMSSLAAAAPDLPVVKTHYLNPDTVARMWKDKVHLHRRMLRNHYLANRFFSERIAARPNRGRGNGQLGPMRWRVISLVREPVVTNISRMFESIEDFIPAYYRRRSRGKLGVEDAVICFFRDFPYHDWNLEWFDTEVAQVFGIDVYAEEFPRERGYHIYRNDRAEMLLLKLESLDRCAAKAFGEFLGLDGFALVSSNVGRKKRYSEDYARFKEIVKFPHGYLDRMYDHRYTRHFYTDVEIARFRSLWSGTTAPPETASPGEGRTVETTSE